MSNPTHLVFTVGSILPVASRYIIIVLECDSDIDKDEHALLEI